MVEHELVVLEVEGAGEGCLDLLSAAWLLRYAVKRDTSFRQAERGGPTFRQAFPAGTPSGRHFRQRLFVMAAGRIFPA